LKRTPESQKLHVHWFIAATGGKPSGQVSQPGARLGASILAGGNGAGYVLPFPGFFRFQKMPFFLPKNNLFYPVFQKSIAPDRTRNRQNVRFSPPLCIFLAFLHCSSLFQSTPARISKKKVQHQIQGNQLFPL
jgi:hypothetical protein